MGGVARSVLRKFRMGRVSLLRPDQENPVWLTTMSSVPIPYERSRRRDTGSPESQLVMRVTTSVLQENFHILYALALKRSNVFNDSMKASYVCNG